MLVNTCQYSGTASSTRRTSCSYIRFLMFTAFVLQPLASHPCIFHCSACYFHYPSCFFFNFFPSSKSISCFLNCFKQTIYTYPIIILDLKGQKRVHFSIGNRVLLLWIQSSLSQKAETFSI